MNAPADEMFKFQVSVSSFIESVLYLGKKILWFRNDGLNSFLLFKEQPQVSQANGSKHVFRTHRSACWLGTALPGKGPRLLHVGTHDQGGLFSEGGLGQVGQWRWALSLGASSRNWPGSLFHQPGVSGM